MNIRKAEITDLEKITWLNTKIFIRNAEYDSDMVPRFAETEEGRKYFKDAIERSDGCFFVVEENREIIGYVNGGKMDLPYRKSKYFQIENLGVLPSNKRKGIGTALLNKITTWAKEQGYEKIYIESYAKNDEALAFYRKHGYEEIDISLEKAI